MPKLETVVAEALDHADPEQGVEPEYSCFNNEVWQWKSSRLFMTEGENYLVSCHVALEFFSWCFFFSQSTAPLLEDNHARVIMKS